MANNLRRWFAREDIPGLPDMGLYGVHIPSWQICQHAIAKLAARNRLIYNFGGLLIYFSNKLYKKFYLFNLTNIIVSLSLKTYAIPWRFS